MTLPRSLDVGVSKLVSVKPLLNMSLQPIETKLKINTNLKLKNILRYLEGKLPGASPQTDAYYSWLNVNPLEETLWDTYCLLFGDDEELKPLMNALEEVNRLLEVL